MRHPKRGRVYFFVDESGDPTFYDAKGRLIVGQGGCSKIFILGFVRLKNPGEARKKLDMLRRGIMRDEYLQAIPSVRNKTSSFFHAKDDAPEIRERVYKLLKGIEFKAKFVVARKREKIFEDRHNRKPDLFYNDMITNLFEDELHLAENNFIYFAARGSSTRQEVLEKAIQSARFQFESKNNIKVDTNVQVQAQTLSGEPSLQIIDYLNWAIYRAWDRNDLRYLKFLWGKIACIYDIYDFSKNKRVEMTYGRYQRTDINKISPL